MRLRALSQSNCKISGYNDLFLFGVIEYPITRVCASLTQPFPLFVEIKNTKLIIFFTVGKICFVIFSDYLSLFATTAFYQRTIVSFEK